MLFHESQQLVGTLRLLQKILVHDEELVEAEPVGEMDQRDIALEGQRRVLPRMVARHHEAREFHRSCSLFY